MRQPLLNVYIKMSYKSVRWRIESNGILSCSWRQYWWRSSLHNYDHSIRPREQSTPRHRGRRAHSGDGSTRGPPRRAGLGARLCPAVSHRWVAGVHEGVADPLWPVGQQRPHVLPQPSGEKQRGTVGRQDLRDVVDHALSHRQSALADLDGEEYFALGVL